VAALCAVAVLAAAPGAQARTDPPAGEFFGLNVEQLFSGSFAGPQQWSAYVSRFSEQGIRTGRVAAFWDRIEPNPPSGGFHNYRWEYLDRVAATLAAYGVRMKPILTHTPQWASSGPHDSDYMSYPPHTPAQFGEFARALAARYGANGDFWRSRSYLPYVPVLHYEIWNEQNHAFYWKPAPDPAAYVRVYNAARTGIRSVDPGARVLVGGVVWNDDAQYIRGMYEAGGPDWAPDGIGLHPYANSIIGIVVNLRRVHHTLESMGKRPPIYLSELGWFAAPPGQRGADHWYLGALGDATRAGLIGLLADIAMRSDCNIKNYVLYDVIEPGLNLYDTATNPNVSGQAFHAAVARYPESRDGSVSVCGAGSPPAEQFKLELDPRPGENGCFTPYVTYRGLPIEEARVFFNAEGRGMRVTLTNAHGEARYCPTAEEAAERMWMWAEVSWENAPSIARSDDFACNPCTRAPPGTRLQARATADGLGQGVHVKTGKRTGAAFGRIGLAIRPNSIRAGRRVRLVFSVWRRVGRRRRPVVGATVHFAGLPLRTNKRGRVAWFARYNRPGRYRVVATKLNSHRAVGWLRVVR
jgi:hypothetical protein